MLFGTERQRRTMDERLGKVFAGVVIAAVLCAGCVGWSFISHRVIGKSGYGTTSVPASTSPPVPTTQSSGSVIFRTVPVRAATADESGCTPSTARLICA
ncbi:MULTISPECIES: hypothetical protein [unclassified Streptomyces]|uniref:hypothetical protein n=1 Tax=unclassified Streptomyces TaxID=2593676 RepID=UPI00278C0264|nr:MULTISPECIES: hypothetical protein [unclassified Streptomyces]